MGFFIAQLYSLNKYGFFHCSIGFGGFSSFILEAPWTPLHLKLRYSILNKSKQLPKGQIYPQDLLQQICQEILPNPWISCFPSPPKKKGKHGPHFSPTSPSRSPPSFPNLVAPFRLPPSCLPTPRPAGTTWHAPNRTWEHIKWSSHVARINQCSPRWPDVMETVKIGYQQWACINLLA